MSRKTVVYKNDLNIVPLRKFTSIEIDLFFSMCNKLKERGTEEINIPFKELKGLSNYQPTATKRFIEDLKRVYDKVLQLTYTEYSGLSFKTFVLFTSYEVNAEDKVLTVSVNPKLKNILNDITGGFTKFELEELTHIKSSYAKNMFRLLKQYKHTGYFKIRMEDFRERLDVPESYRMSNINTSVLTPIINELDPLFSNLHINKIKARKGRKIEWLEFVFDPEKRIQTKKQPEKPQYKSKGKAYRNREKTPEWLEHPNEQLQDEKDLDFEKDRQAFLERLNQDWGE
ncbi:MAG: RepB family plasmid replication initiator protein [Lactococcus lactis]|nr:RepB family plasmid replication initiator protein [Lactococcus lactis]